MQCISVIKCSVCSRWLEGGDQKIKGSVVWYGFAINRQMVLFKHQTTYFFTCLKMYYYLLFFMNAAVEPLISMLFT